MTPDKQVTVAGKPQGRAAPAGGAFWCRGCIVFGLTAMTATGVIGGQDIVELPSGVQSTLFEQILEQTAAGPVHRFRFVAPDAAMDVVKLENLTADFDFLCQTFALPRLSDAGTATGQIVISLAQAPTEFGVANPDVRQFFEAYSIDGTRCIWEAF